jgi:hypothetical protein
MAGDADDSALRYEEALVRARGHLDRDDLYMRNRIMLLWAAYITRLLLLVAIPVTVLAVEGPTIVAALTTLLSLVALVISLHLIAFGPQKLWGQYMILREDLLRSSMMTIESLLGADDGLGCDEKKCALNDAYRRLRTSEARLSAIAEGARASRDGR